MSERDSSFADELENSSRYEDLGHAGNRKPDVWAHRRTRGDVGQPARGFPSSATVVNERDYTRRSSVHHFVEERFERPPFQGSISAPAVVEVPVKPAEGGSSSRGFRIAR